MTKIEAPQRGKGTQGGKIASGKPLKHERLGMPSQKEMCTGLSDKHGKLIYEGDICEGNYAWGGVIGVIKFSHGCFHLAYVHDSSFHTDADIDFSQLEIVGNIYDQPGGMDAQKQ